MTIGDNVYYARTETVYSQGSYRVVHEIGSALPSGQNAPDIYDVNDLERGVNLATFENQEEAINYVKGLLSSDTKIYKAKTQENADGSVKETNPPKLPEGTDKTISQSGTNRPSTPPVAVGEVGPKTTIQKTNTELYHDCDWTIKLNIDVCGEKVIEFTEHWTKRLTAKGEWFAGSLTPIFQFLMDIKETIEKYLDMLMEYMNEIKDFIKCINSIVSAITQLVNFIATLPASLISQTMSCLNGFAGMLKKASTVVTQPVQDVVNQSQSSITNIMNNANSLNKGSSAISTTMPKPTKFTMP